VSRKSLNRTETRQFVVFHLVKAAQIVKQLKYVPPPARGYELAINRVKNGSYGNAFGGKTEIAINIDALLKPELKLTLSRNVRSS